MSATLVLGAGGLIGRALCRRLAAQGEEVVGVGHGEEPPGHPGGWTRMDLAAGLDAAALPGRVESVVHLAQSLRFREFPGGARDVFAVNVASVAAALELARERGASSFVLASTGGLYAPSLTPLREDDALAPNDQYSRSKAAAELLAASYAPCFAVAVLRPFFVFGPGQRGTMLVPRLAGRLARGEEIRVEGSPGLRLNPIHADDAARAFAAARIASGVDDDKSPLVVNVAGEEELSLTQLVERLAAALGREPSIRHVGPGPDGDLVADVSRMRETLGVVPEIGLDEGLAGLARP